MALRGEFTPPGDKSVSHRLILLSILADGEIMASGVSDGEDIKNSLSIFKALGGEVLGGGSRLTIKGLGGNVKFPADQVLDLDCGSSGTAIRLAGGILAGLPGQFLLDGDSQLRRRPMERLADPLRQMGARVETSSGHAPINIKGGGLHGIEYVNSDSSAQLKSAVILASLSAGSPSRIIESIPTRDHTERMIGYFGGHINISGSQIDVAPSRLKLPDEIVIPADPSGAAFFLVGAAVIPDSLVTAKNILLSNSRIGYLKVLDRMGASVSISLEQEKPEPSGNVTVEYTKPLQATEISAEEIPSLIDEIPILSLAAACAQGVTVFRQVRELRYKETDRLTAIKHQLGALGGRVWVECDDLFIEGPTKAIMPETLDSGHDHRIAMTMHMALAMAGKSIPVIGEDSISASYPNFKNDLAMLSGGQQPAAV